MIHEISITGLRVFAHHGVFDFERKTGQPFVIDLTVWVDASAADDDLAGTVSYADLADLLKREVERDPVNLIETLAQRLLKAVLSHSSKITEARVTVHKPEAPIDAEFTDVSVTVRSGRP